MNIISFLSLHQYSTGVIHKFKCESFEFDGSKFKIKIKYSSSNTFFRIENELSKMRHLMMYNKQFFVVDCLLSIKQGGNTCYLEFCNIPVTDKSTVKVKVLDRWIKDSVNNKWIDIDKQRYEKCANTLTLLKMMEV